MNKVVLYIIMCILLSSFALAEQFYVEDIRIYVADSRQRDVDVNGGDFDVYRGDVVKVRVELRNNYSTDFEDIDFILVAEGIYKNGDDLEVTSENNDLQQGDKKNIYLEFTVPSDSIYDYYDLVLEIDGDFKNGTHLDDWAQTWQLEVKKKEDDVDDSPSSILENTLTNCTSALGMIPNYITCADDKNKIEIDKRAAEVERDNSQELLTECRTKQEDYETFEDQFNNCTLEKEGMLTSAACTSKIRMREDELEKSSKTNYFPYIIVGIIALVWWQKKKSQPVAEEEV